MSLGGGLNKHGNPDGNIQIGLPDWRVKYGWMIVSAFLVAIFFIVGRRSQAK